jgi:hypothetical protein
MPVREITDPHIIAALLTIVRRNCHRPRAHLRESRRRAAARQSRGLFGSIRKWPLAARNCRLEPDGCHCGLLNP